MVVAANMYLIVVRCVTGLITSCVCLLWSVAGTAKQSCVYLVTPPSHTGKDARIPALANAIQLSPSGEGERS